MKRWYVLLVVFLAGFLTAGAQLTEDEKDELEGSMYIRAVTDDDYEDDFDVEYFLLKFGTNQRVRYQRDEDGKDQSDYKFYVRVTVELTDKKTGTVGYTQFARLRGGVDTEYTGEDDWKFIVPYGDMKRPKLTAYVIQYGVLLGDEFVVCVTDTDDVDTLEELTKRTPKRLEELPGREKLKPKIEHQYYYTNQGTTEPSGWE